MGMRNEDPTRCAARRCNQAERRVRPSAQLDAARDLCTGTPGSVGLIALRDKYEA